METLQEVSEAVRRFDSWIRIRLALMQERDITALAAGADWNTIWFFLQQITEEKND